LIKFELRFYLRGDEFKKRICEMSRRYPFPSDSRQPVCPS
jgi:hypothetical protein